LGRRTLCTKMGCLYQLTSPSGKSYIGISSKTAATRFLKHTEHALGKRQNGVLYSALRKYDPNSFKVETLVIANDWKYLCDLEMKVIAAFGTKHPNGYNMTDGGEGVVGPRASGFSEKVSIAQKKRYERPEERDKLRKAMEKAHITNAARHAANRINGKAPWQVRKFEKASRLGSPEQKAKSSAAIKASMARPDIAAKVKACAQARSADPEWRGKISASKRGKKTGPCSQERKAKISAARTAEWSNPIIRERRLVGLAKARAEKAKK
jgi:GIY-YIG catalytic domain